MTLAQRANLWAFAIPPSEFLYSHTVVLEEMSRPVEEPSKKRLSRQKLEAITTKRRKVGAANVDEKGTGK